MTAYAIQGVQGWGTSGEPFAYRMLSPRVWYAREGDEPRVARSPVPHRKVTQSAISQMHEDRRIISESEQGHGVDPEVIEHIAEQIAEAIWLDVHGSK